MNIEFMMKAVNDLKGDLDNCYNDMSIGLFLFMDKDDLEYVICDSISGNDICLTYIGETASFNNLVTELSKWQPTLPKVETVEYEGNIYEIGKLYKFTDKTGDVEIGELSDAGNANDGNGFMFQSKVSLKSSSKFEWWEIISEVNSLIGTITPAPTKLIDGEAYMFDYESSKSLIGILHTSIKFGIEHRMFCMPKDDAKYNSEFCTNIIPLSSNK